LLLEGDWLKAARRLVLVAYVLRRPSVSHLSQSALAKLTGISQGRVSQLITDYRDFLRNSGENEGSINNSAKGEEDDI
jgi:predicted transcriptional regulator